jgi:hypothetical protein
LLIEWPEGEPEPRKYWMSNPPEKVALRNLVALAKQRWIIERDYQELGLGHFEGRGWHGFHHHATLAIAAYGFLVAERSRFSPSARSGHLGLPVPELRQTSTPEARVRPERHNPNSRHPAHPPRQEPAPQALPMPLLRSSQFMTQ